MDRYLAKLPPNRFYSSRRKMEFRTTVMAGAGRLGSRGSPGAGRRGMLLGQVRRVRRLSKRLLTKARSRLKGRIRSLAKLFDSMQCLMLSFDRRTRRALLPGPLATGP